MCGVLVCILTGGECAPQDALLETQRRNEAAQGLLARWVVQGVPDS
jgi:hypothetical protein